MGRWPWITTVLTVVAALSPPGQEVISSSLFSGEQLSRSIGQFLLICALGIVVVLGVLEWLILRIIRDRRARSGNMT